MSGYSLLELLVALALLLVLGAMAVPRLGDALDHWRARSAASFVASRVALTRMQALARNTTVALRFEDENGAIRMRPYADGNGDGVRAADIAGDIDTPILTPDRLDQLFPGVRFGFVEDAALIDGRAAGPTDDPIRFGTSREVSCTPDGTTTGGSVYLRSRTGWQYAVVVAGATGRTRVLQFEPGLRRWVAP